MEWVPWVVGLHVALTGPVSKASPSTGLFYPLLLFDRLPLVVNVHA